MGVPVGRDDVVAEAARSLDAEGVVVLEGPAGIGKSTVWAALTDRARTTGMTVLACAPTEAERMLPLAALADLLLPLRDLFGELRAPQRAAVEAAVLDVDPDGADGTIDPRVLATATRSLLDLAVADAEPGLLVAVDDAMWLDPASEGALRYAIRRRHGWGLLVARRTTDAGESELPLGLEATERVDIVIDPLSAADLRRLIGDRFGTTLGRSELARITHESQGNPLIAIELARALFRSPDRLSSGGDLPVLGSVQELVEATLVSLPPPAPEAARLASLLISPSTATITAAGVPVEALDAVEDAGLVRVESDGRVRFVHPTFATAVRASLPAGERRQRHRRLAEVCVDPDERAWQLARGVVEQSASLSGEIADAAVRAKARGAPEIAAGLFQRAAELTPGHSAELGQERVLRAAECLFDSGDCAAAEALASTIARDARPALAAEALLLRGFVRYHMSQEIDAQKDAERALELTPPGSGVAGRIHGYLAATVYSPSEARAHAVAAVELIPPPPADAPPGTGQIPDDRSMIGGSLLAIFHNDVRAGEPARPELLERALAGEGEAPYWINHNIPVHWWQLLDDHPRARRRLEWLYEWAVDTGDEPSRQEMAMHLGQIEVQAGRFAEAERWLGLAFELGEQLSSALVEERWCRAQLDLLCGDIAAATRMADALAEVGDPVDASRAQRVLLHLGGLIALADGRPADAAQHFGDLAEILDGFGIVESFAYRLEGDWIEALLGVGDLDGAELRLERLRQRHEHVARPWTLLALARSRLLIAGARRESTDAALAEVEAALAEVPEDVNPLERARCRLAAGVAHRRARRKKAAREELDQALAELEKLGAVAYVARARAELDRLGAPTMSGELTPTEERVARLAADGKTNREIADVLFVSPKTVESNLARAYRKLGIARRAELGIALERP